MIRTHFVVAIAPIRLWTLIPWISSFSNGFEFTWAFLVIARYWEEEEYEV